MTEKREIEDTYVDLRRFHELKAKEFLKELQLIREEDEEWSKYDSVLDIARLTTLQSQREVQED